MKTKLRSPFKEILMELRDVRTYYDEDSRHVEMLVVDSIIGLIKRHAPKAAKKARKTK